MHDDPNPDPVPEVEPRPTVEPWYRTRRARRVLAYCAVALVAAYGVWRAEGAAESASTAANDAAAVAGDLVDENTDRLVGECEGRNDFRRLFREYLSATSTPLTPEVLQALPGYTDLDPATRNYVDALVAVLNAGAMDAAQVRAEYVEGFPIADCAKLRDELEAKRAATGQADE